MAQITKTKYVHPEVLVDTQWVEEHLDDKQGRTAQSNITVNKQYYDKKNCRFVLCDACFWFATILMKSNPSDAVSFTNCSNTFSVIAY